MRMLLKNKKRKKSKVINKSITKQMSDSWADDIFDIVYNDKGEIVLIDFNSKNSSKILSTMTSLIELILGLLKKERLIC